MSSGSRKKRQSVNQTVGGLLFGFEQQVLRTTPPPEELVHHARPDHAVPGAEGELVTLELPDSVDLEDPWAGIEDELSDEDDPWADYAPPGDDDDALPIPAEPRGDPEDGPADR